MAGHLPLQARQLTSHHGDRSVPMSFQKPRCVSIDREGAGRGASALPLIFSMEQAALSAGSAADGHNWPAMLAKHACMIIAYVNRKVTSLAARAVLLHAFVKGLWRPVIPTSALHPGLRQTQMFAARQAPSQVERRWCLCF